MSLNKYLVGLQGDRIRVMMFLATSSMSKEDALNLAGWLVTLAADDPEKEFFPLLKEIQES